MSAEGVEVDDESFAIGDDVGEDGAGLFCKLVVVAIAGGVVAGEEPFCSGVAGGGGCLSGCAMTAFGGVGQMLVAVGGLVHHEGDWTRRGGQLREVARIGEVSVGEGRGCWTHQARVGDNQTIVFAEVGPLLNGLILREWHAMEVAFALDDVGEGGFLFENVAHCIHTMAQRHGADDEVFGLKSYLLTSGVDDIVFDIEGGVVREIIEDTLQHTSTLLEGMYGEFTTHGRQTESADETRQTKYMITMEVSEEDVSQSAEFQMVMLKGELCTLSAVDHIKIAVMLHHGATRLMTQSRFCRTASQGMYLKTITHTIYNTQKRHIYFTAYIADVSD